MENKKIACSHWYNLLL